MTNEAESSQHRRQAANKVMEVVAGAEAVTIRRRLDDLPLGLSLEGSREVATLTLAARHQDFQFKPVMMALEKLSIMKDWGHEFLVADNQATLDWHKSPMRRYASFKDFYVREIEATWGRWENLQHTWKRIVNGELSEDEAKAEIAARAQAANEQDLAHPPQPGRRTDLLYKQDTDVKEVRKKTGNSKEYAHRVLRDKRPDIHERVLKGELTAHAGMVEAGFRKKVARKKPTALDKAMRAIAKLTELEWHKLKGLEDCRRRGWRIGDLEPDDDGLQRILPL
jgi:hypothetical protein